MSENTMIHAQEHRARSPKFEAVARDLRHKILTGQLLLGEKLPSTQELGRAFKVSSVTARRGVRQLVKEGLVSSNSDRRGTVVSGTKIRRSLRLATLLCLFRPSYARGRNAVDNYGIDIMESIRGEISTRQYRFIHHALDETDYERRVTEVVQDGAACGIVVDQKTPASIVGRLCKLGVPVVMYNRVLSAPNLSCVSPDFEMAGRESARLFRRKGYQRVAFCYMPAGEVGWDEVGIAEGEQLIRERRSFFEEASACGFMQEEMLPIPEVVNPELMREPEGYGLPRKKPDDWRPLGVLTITDKTALDMTEAIAKTDLVLGRDIGLIGGAEIDISRGVARPPSTWRTDASAIGSTAVRLLLDRVENLQLIPSTVTIPCQFVDHGTA